MAPVKKLLFAPIYLVSLAALLYSLPTILTPYIELFNFDSNQLTSLILVSCLMVISALMFVTFATLASQLIFVAPVIALSSLISLFVFAGEGKIIVSSGLIISQLIAYLILRQKLKIYLSFNAASLLLPAAKNLIWLWAITFSVVYFMMVKADIDQNGVQIPDHLIDRAIQLTGTNPSDISSSNIKGLLENPEIIQQLLPAINNSTGTNKSNPQTTSANSGDTVSTSPAVSASPSSQKTETPNIKLTPEQKELLKNNPEILKQYGIDPEVLDVLGAETTNNPLNDYIHQTVRSQFDNLLKPYLGFIPAILAVLFYFGLSSMSGLLMWLGGPILWILFFVLEKTGLISFKTETKEVQMLVT